MGADCGRAPRITWAVFDRFRDIHVQCSLGVPPFSRIDGHAEAGLGRRELITRRVSRCRFLGNTTSAI